MKSALPTGDTQGGRKPYGPDLPSEAEAERARRLARLPVRRAVRSIRRAARRAAENGRGRKQGDEKKSTEATIEVQELVREIQTELRRERAEVLDPLLHRFAQLGQRLRSGEDVPVPLLEEGLSLLDAYIVQLHDIHVREFAEAGASEDHAEACFLPLAEMEGEPERGEHRLSTLRALLTGYQARPLGYRNLLGIDLRNEAVAELSWEGYTEDYARTCLPSHLTPQAARDWKDAIEGARQNFVEIRSKVTEFLSKTNELVAPRVTLGRHGGKEGPAGGA